MVIEMSKMVTTNYEIDRRDLEKDPIPFVR